MDVAVDIAVDVAADKAVDVAAYAAADVALQHSAPFKYAQKYHIRKLEQISKSPKNCKNDQKGKKIAVFLPWRAEFCNNKKRLRHSLSFIPER